MSRDLFRIAPPSRAGHLRVSERHQIWFEESGTAGGLPVVVLHGGPGAGIDPEMYRVHDPALFRVVMFDQRGCGRSLPLGELRENTTWDLVGDTERLREHLGIERWIVSGGSWGSTLALAYAQRHPERCLAIVLRGVWLGTPPEIAWFHTGLRNFYPDVWADTAAALGPAAAADFPRALDDAILDPDPAVAGPAAVLKSRYEWRSASVDPDTTRFDAELTPAYCIPYQRIGVHYGRHDFFLAPDQLLRDLPRIRHLPCTIVNGRLDVVCPPITAHRLKQAWPEAELRIVPLAGHFASEPGIAAALRETMDGLAARFGHAPT